MILTTKLTLNQTKLAAEDCYLSYDFSNAIKYDGLFLKNYNGKYPFEIIKEHMAAYTFAALITNTTYNAKHFYFNLMEIYKSYFLPISQINILVEEIKKQFNILNGNIDFYINEDAYKEPIKYLDAKEFFDGLVNNHIRLSTNTENALYYDIVYIYQYGYPDDFIRYYEEYNTIIDNGQIHIKAAKIYNYFNKPEEAGNALKNYVDLLYSNDLCNETPMSLFLYYSLYSLYSHELFYKLFDKN